MVPWLTRRVESVSARGSRVSPATSTVKTASAATNVLLWIAAATLLFEEWFWVRSTRAIARFALATHLSAIESWVRRRTHWQALGLFVLPVVVLYPFKVLALIALARGDIALGGLAFVSAKLAATALFARLYQLTEPAILHFRWVRRGRMYVLKFRAFVHGWLQAQPAYRLARATIRERSMHIARRYRAACRLHRRRRGRGNAGPWRITPVDAARRARTTALYHARTRHLRR
jgi:hypothetical protein